MKPRDSSPRLGRGLASLFAETQAEMPDSAVISAALPLSSLEPGPFQPRAALDPESLAELTASVQTQGILQPLLARPHPTRPERYQIVAGERRWRAAQAAGLSEVPVLVRPLSDAEAMAAALVENLQRKDLNAIEEAEGYRRLLDDFGLTHERLGQAVGKSRSHVANSIRLLQLSPTIRAQVENGALSAGHARALLSLLDPETAAELVVSKGLNVRQTEALANRVTQNPSQRSSRGSIDTDAVARDLSDHLGLRVQIECNGRSGSMRLYFQSLDQLDHIVARLGRT